MHLFCQEIESKMANNYISHFKYIQF